MKESWYRIKQRDNPLKTNKSTCFTQPSKYIHKAGTKFPTTTKQKPA
jgi:hypothetical protein